MSATIRHDRRMFLRGAGGAVLAIPTLTSLLPRQARAAFTPPKRFVVISADHGVVENLWYPTGYKRTLPDGQTYTEKELASIVGPVSNIIGPAFDPLKPKLTLFRGLDSAVYGPQAGHQRSYTLCGTSQDSKAPGASLDVVLSRSSKVVLPGTSVPHVNCGLLGENLSFTVSGTSMKSTFMYSSAKSTFDFLFNGFSASDQQDSAAIVRRKTLLINAVRDHYRALAGSPKLGSNDKQVLEEFMTSFSTVEQRVKDFKVPVGCKVEAPTYTTYAKNDQMSYERRLDETMAVVALALKCGIIQVAHIGMPTPEDSRPLPDSEYAVFRNLDTATVKFTQPIHNYSHNDGNAAETNPIFQRWLAGFAARFMTSLNVQESAESPATFLDNSLVMYVNKLSHGSLHVRYDIPVLLAGSLGGRFRAGRFLDYSQNVKHTVQNSVGKPVGVDYNRFLVSVLQGFGLTEAEYQQPGQPPGFGSDARHGGLHPMLDTSKRREPLPGVLAG